HDIGCKRKGRSRWVSPRSESSEDGVSEARRRVGGATAMSGGDARAELGVRPLLGVSGFLDPSQGFDVDLRGGSKGQGRSGIAGGEESWRRSELTGVEVSLQRSCAVVVL